MASYTQPKSCEDFHVAIICALPSEASAVIEQFDKVWETWGIFEQASRDLNAYSYGTIGSHNVVVAHMPGMGKASAAGVAAFIGVSFPRIELALVVGICGGVPYCISGEEIRLGDVIVSEGIVEYDLQRRYPDGVVRKDAVLDSLSRPIPKIRALINKLKSDHCGKQLKTKTLQNLKYLQEISDRYRYPGAESDQLYKSDYRHKHHGPSSCPICSRCVGKDDEVCFDALELSCLELRCDERMAIPRQRPPREVRTSLTHGLMIHYGLVASGDTVMKSGEGRDDIAKKDKVIAFEMEGAGVWEKLPCVVIKGVCDYADSHKNKKWQNYAAAAGASCMKAFLEQWRSVERNATIAIQPDNSTQMMECLRTLSFSNIDDREGNISLAHQDTCDWLFETTQFRGWLNRDDLLRHNGVLWIKGNPGAGKSTLMKHTLLYCKENFTDHIIAAYFFNARGNALEKTPLGMLRSLLFQLLDQDPPLGERFLPIFLAKQKKLDREWQWSIGELKTYLLSDMGRYRPGRKPVLLLIDALDECNEADVRDVVSFLESLSIRAVSNNITLKICLSSRYYPTIDMKVKMELMVEEQKGHDRDIAKYVHHKLRVQDDSIESDLLRKAQHIFMWVVLVVEMVNKAYDDGNIRAMRRKLDEVPSDLDKVFSILLGGEQRNRQATILMLQWVLFAERLLKPEELYLAVLAGIEEEGLGPWDRQNDSPKAIKRYITNTSRGLVEVRKEKSYYSEADKENVQFIHGSVNDFLLRHNRLQTLDPRLAQHAIGSSHDRLASCCMSYIKMKELDPLAKDGFNREEDSDSEEDLHSKREFEVSIDASYPFLRYATENILYHANRAHEGGHTQTRLLRELQIRDGEFNRLRNLQKLSNNLEESSYAGGDLLYAAILDGCYGLAQAVLAEDLSNINAQGGYYGNALQVASHRGDLEVVELLLEKGANVNAQGGYYGNALQAASYKGDLEVVELLFEKGANVNAQGGHYGNDLQAASISRARELVELLLEKGADVNAQGGEYGNALQAASSGGYLKIVELLLEKGADVNAQGGYHGNALQVASYEGTLEIVKLLLEKGADVNTQGGFYRNALQAASYKGALKVVELLLKKGANINSQGGYYGNALQAASYGGALEVVELLLEKGADVNAQGGKYNSAFEAASRKGKEEIAELLLEAGAITLPEEQQVVKVTSLRKRKRGA